MNLPLFTISLIMAIIVLIFAGVVLLQLIIANFRKTEGKRCQAPNLPGVVMRQGTLHIAF
jgi:hypothetical protein